MKINSHDAPALNLNDTLENIENAIIRYVFEDEGANSTKAAARLGIGRSTLWRKLNNEEKNPDK